MQSRHPSMRLRNYDYTRPNAYFVTICTYHRQILLGKINNGMMDLNSYGDIALSCWEKIPEHYSAITLASFTVMPNHIHGIIIIGDNDIRAGLKPAPTKYSLSEIVRAFKTFSARDINQARKTPGSPVWQRYFYEHIVRSEEEFNQISEYIINNSLKWILDKENPERKNSVDILPFEHG